MGASFTRGRATAAVNLCRPFLQPFMKISYTTLH